MSAEVVLWSYSCDGRVSYYPPLGGSGSQKTLHGAPASPVQAVIAEIETRKSTGHAAVGQTAYNGAYASRTLLRSEHAARAASREREVQREQRLRAREIHSTLISQTTAEGVLRSAAAAEAELGCGHVVTALHRAARLSRSTPQSALQAKSEDFASDARWLHLTTRACSMAAEMLPMSLALSAWSLATVKHQSTLVMGSLADALLVRLSECKPHDLSGFAWAFAALEMVDEPVLTTLAQESAVRADEFLPQDLSLVAWAYARVFLYDAPFFAALAAATIWRHAEFAGQNLANSMWAFATVLHEDEVLFKDLADMCRESLSSLGALEVSTALWSCATVGHYVPKLFSEAVQRVQCLAGSLESQQLTSIAWSFARVAHRSSQLFQCVAGAVVERRLPLEPTEINRLVWAFAYPGRPAEERTGRAGGFRNAELLSHLASQALRQMARLDALQASSIAWSFATLSYRDQALFCALGTRFADADTLRDFDAQNIAYLLWAFARARVRHPTLVEAAGQEAARRGLGDFEQSHLSMLLWAIARLSQPCLSIWAAARKYVPDTYASHIGNAQGVAGLAMTIHALHQAGQRDIALALLERILEESADVSGDAYGGWLSGCQATGDVETELRLWEHMARTAPSHGMRAVAGNMAAFRALELGRQDRAVTTLVAVDEAGLTNVVSLLLHERCLMQPTRATACPLGWKPRLRSEGVRQARAAGRILAKWDYYKEIGVLDYVLSRASPGDADTVCLAIEAFSREENLYLKLGAEEKGLALDAMLRSLERDGIGTRNSEAAARGLAKPRLIVEVGCYVGYSSVRMAQRLAPGGRVVTMEVDPYHAAVSRSVLELSGLSSCVEVWLGHSEHMIPRLLTRFGQHCTHGTFFDQRGTRYHEDLELFESNDLLAAGALVSADNVVRPGAPEFMWRVCDPLGSYETQAIAHRDYGQDSVEDWISISRFCPSAMSAGTAEGSASCPDSLQQLAYDSDTIRNRSVNERVTEEEWRIFAVRVAKEYAAAGICPPVLRPKDSIDGLHVELLPWTR